MANAEKLLDLPLEDVIGDRFGIYSKYIIQERALPDVRDGLKPVQRRILYAMYQDGNTSDKPYRKSAKTVGNVIGNFHPHGDTSVYDAMVRLSQDWKVRNVMVEMHGNNGSLDGDPPAAMRYTEARLSAIASELLRDIEKETVAFVPNFDDSTNEPIVLPAKFPNLLVNGSTGISAGYATDIPPHNLEEVIDATIMLLERPNSTLEDLMTVLKGPDFPTGGTLQGIDGIKKGYQTGKGKVVVRGKADLEDLRGGRQQIVITELPYEVNKANMVKKMEELRLDRKVEGVAEVRDETDRTGTRIIIELKKDGDATGVLNYFYKTTDLQITYNFNMVAIDKKAPRLMSLTGILQSYIDHQKEVITNRTIYELNKAKNRQHIVDGLIKAVSILDDVIATIRGSKDKKDAKNNLMQKYGFTDAQAEAIVNLQLYRLTNTDIQTLQEEAEQLKQTIEKLEGILASENKLNSVIKKELKAVRKTFGSPRRTRIEETIEEIKIDLEVMVAPEDVMVSLTKEGYVKRSSLRSYSASNGDNPPMKESDRMLFKGEVNTTEKLLVFTNKGQYLYFPVHELPESKWKDIGQHVSHLLPLDTDEKLITAIKVSDFKEDAYLTFITKNGQVKRTPLSTYQAQRYSKPLMGLRLKGDDELVNVEVTRGQDNIFFVTKYGYGLWFDEEEVKEVGQRTAGVKGIGLKDGDEVVWGSAFATGQNPDLVIATHRCAVKKMKLYQAFEKNKRSRRGLVMLRELKRKPHRIVACAFVNDNDILNFRTANGQQKELQSNELPSSDRYSNGKFIFDEDQTGAITDLWVIRDDKGD